MDMYQLEKIYVPGTFHWRGRQRRYQLPQTWCTILWELHIQEESILRREGEGRRERGGVVGNVYILSRPFQSTDFFPSSKNGVIMVGYTPSGRTRAVWLLIVLLLVAKWILRVTATTNALHLHMYIDMAEGMDLANNGIIHTHVHLSTHVTNEWATPPVLETFSILLIWYRRSGPPSGRSHLCFCWKF